ncbi:MAG: CGNR zinc finger domain-containing protein [Steroidobacteraceae bacterium]
MQVPFDALAQNLVNSYDDTRSPPDCLQTPQHLKELLVQHGLHVKRVTQADLARVRRLRDDVREVFEAGGGKQAVQLINTLLENADVRPQLDRSRGVVALDWQVAAAADVVDQVRSAAALNLALLAERFGFERFRVCVTSPCRDVFVDVSKNATRRYCGMICANRARVASFRERQREGR